MVHLYPSNPQKIGIIMNPQFKLYKSVVRMDGLYTLYLGLKWVHYVLYQLHV